jgi:hypothetical protein
MAEISKEAREYLTNLEKSRLAAVERGGVEAGTRLVQGQKRKAQQLSGDDNKMQAVAQRRLQSKVKPKYTPPVKKKAPVGVITTKKGGFPGA